MSIFRILRRLYEEYFGWFFDSEMDFDRIFNDLDNFHAKALPESENKAEAMYAKFLKNNFVYILAPIAYMILKYFLTKYTNAEYLNRMIEKEMEG